MSPYNTIKSNVDACWLRAKASIVVLVHKAKGEIMCFWYNGFECASSIAIEFLAIQKAILIYHNFKGCEIQIVTAKLLWKYCWISQNVHGKPIESLNLLRVCLYYLIILFPCSVLRKVIKMPMRFFIS